MNDFNAPLRYRAASLETAACLWEAVLDMEQNSRGNDLGLAIAATREAMGSWGLRLTVIGWTDAVDEAWRIADTVDGKSPMGGEYGEAFDWEFIPDWIAENVDWSVPALPSLRQPPKPADPIRLALGDLAPWLLDEMGMEVEICGGGPTALMHTHSSGWFVRITADAEPSLPTADDWMVGAYSRGNLDAPQYLTSSGCGLSLRQAVAGACSICAEA